MLRFSVIALIFYSAVSGKLPTVDLLGMAAESIAAVSIALLLVPTVGRMME